MWKRDWSRKTKLEDTAMDFWANKVKEKLKNKIKSLKKSKQIDNTSPAPHDEEVKIFN